MIAGVFALLFAAGVEAQIITTIAGGGPNNIPALNAGVFLAYAVAVDAAGNVFITSFNPELQNNQQQHRVFKVDTSGLLTVVAGDGTLCQNATASCGDGGPAIAAKLNLPTGVAVDGSGNVYIADLGDARIRKVDASGIITTVAGNGNAGFSGDGGPATGAKLNSPAGVTLDHAGNFYIADFGNARIRKVDSRGIITTAAGNGSAGFSGDGGPATSAQLNEVSGVTVDSLGNLFIADTGNQRILRWIPPASSQPWLATASLASPATGDRPPVRNYAIPSEWPSTVPPTSLSLIQRTIAYARWMPLEPSILLPVAEPLVSAVTVAPLLSRS